MAATQGCDIELACDLESVVVAVAAALEEDHRMWERPVSDGEDLLAIARRCVWVGRHWFQG